MFSRPLTGEDGPALGELLMRAPSHNLFHLSALREHGLPAAPDPFAPLWAEGAFREDGTLAGAVVASRGTGGIYHTPGDRETLTALAATTVDRALSGTLSLLSGHASQIGALVPMVQQARPGHPDYCDFLSLLPGDLAPVPRVPGFSEPRQAGHGDMERLIDFYMTGFYTLARLPSRAAWRERLDEQLRFRTLYFIEGEHGRVVSGALSSAESAVGAMLGGVATLSELEGRGLSTLCVAALCEHLFRRGIPEVSLFYLKGNTPAARVYEKLGFRGAGEWLLVPLGHRWG